MIKGVIFDFNGTILWDTHLHIQAWNAFLDKHQLVLTEKEKDEKIHGKSNEKIMSAIFDSELSPNEILNLSIEKEDIYQEMCIAAKLDLAPGAIDFFDYLNKIEVPYTIATASDKYNVDFYFDQFNLSKYFDKSKVAYSDGKTPSKPHPQIYLNAMFKIQKQANEVLVFEDSPSGITSASNANAKKIIIVHSHETDYSTWNYDQIKNFDEVDKKIFH